MLIYFYIKEESASCTNCTSFVCTANQTNILRMSQDDIHCISFERNVDTHHNTCPGLSIEEKIADPDPTNNALSVFSVEAKRRFYGETNIECVDAKLSSKALNITSTCIVHFVLSCDLYSYLYNIYPQVIHVK